LTWLTRENLAALIPPDSLPSGFLLATNPGESFISISLDERADLIDQSAATLRAAGITSGNRAVLSLTSDGTLGGAQLAEALVRVGASAAVVGPRGRMRLLAAIRTLRPDVWLTTPTGALDFLARLYLEFNVDPVELDLAHILLVGEIGSPGTEHRLAAEFEAQVTGLYCDPIFGAALAHGREGRWQIQDPAVLGFSDLESDTWSDAWQGSSDQAGQSGQSEPADPLGVEANPSELVLRPAWSKSLSEQTLRTGEVVGPTQDASLFGQTVGEHILVRGRWLSIPLLRRALLGIDGIAGWRLEISRGDGTLDKLILNLAFERASLVENPMWAGRAREAIASITPIAFEVATELARNDTPSETIDDQRGHHLGFDRQAVAKRLDDPRGALGG